jgi:serine/threonine protein kinase
VLKVLDFGIARYVGRSTDTMAGVLKGKHADMSPEQVEGLHLDGRSDLFSLGVLLYELATGSRLFRADTVPDTLNRVRLCEVPDLAELRPDLDPALAETIMGCLSREPDERPDDAATLAAWCHTLITGGLPEAHGILATWFEEVFGPERADEAIADEIGSYYASLVSAEDKGEETTDQIGVPDATRVFRPDADLPLHAPEALPTQARWLLYAMVLSAVACVLWMLF